MSLVMSLLFVNMKFVEADKILIKRLHELKVHTGSCFINWYAVYPFTSGSRLFDELHIYKQQWRCQWHEINFSK